MTTPGSECKHGMKSGCAYCHVPQSSPAQTSLAQRASTPAPRKRGTSAAMSEKMNDRMLNLKRRLKEIRGGS